MFINRWSYTPTPSATSSVWIWDIIKPVEKNSLRSNSRIRKENQVNKICIVFLTFYKEGSQYIILFIFGSNIKVPFLALKRTITRRILNRVINGPDFPIFCISDNLLTPTLEKQAVNVYGMNSPVVVSLRVHYKLPYLIINNSKSISRQL